MRLVSLRASAVAPHHTDTRLSSRPDAMSSPSTPSTDGGVRSWVITSHATTSSTATLELLREEAGERAFLGLPESPHRHDVLLPVEHHASLVHVTVEVDRELRQPQQRPIDLDESHLAALAARPVPRDRGRGRATS